VKVASTVVPDRRPRRWEERPQAGATVVAVSFREIPVLSMAGWTGADADRVEFADRLREMCHEVGFLRVVDHGISREFLDDYFAALQAFFALPEEVKARIDKARSPWFRGWERVGAEFID